MRSFPARRDGFCGKCSKPIEAGEQIKRLKIPHDVRLPGRYGDMSRYRLITVDYAHANCDPPGRKK